MNKPSILQEFKRMMEARQAEWDALVRAHAAYHEICLTPVVDDAFPGVLDAYEHSMQGLLGMYNRRLEAVRKLQEAKNKPVVKGVPPIPPQENNNEEPADQIGVDAPPSDGGLCQPPEAETEGVDSPSGP